MRDAGTQDCIQHTSLDLRPAQAAVRGPLLLEVLKITRFVPLNA